jgi:hypothetical protein
MSKPRPFRKTACNAIFDCCVVSLEQIHVVLLNISGWRHEHQTSYTAQIHYSQLIDRRSVKAVYIDGIKVRVSNDKQRKKGPPSRVAVVGQENIETVHAPKHIQATGALCMDRVAVLWSVPMAHRPREVKGPMPSR